MLDAQLLERFHRALVNEIRRTRPEYMDAPFTVSQIYEELVPYRTHRNIIGVAMNGDYEDALLRLLGGEGDYLIMDSEMALRDIRKELRSRSPDPGRFREHGSAGVRLNPATLVGTESAAGTTGNGHAMDLPVPVADLAPAPFGDDPLEDRWQEAPEGSDGHASAPEEALAVSELEPDPAPEPDTSPEPVAPDEPASSPGVAGIPVADLAPAGSDPGAEPHGESRTPEHEPEVPAASVGSDAPPEGTSAACHWCAEPLPDRSGLNYCPHCGGDVRLRPCPACGEALEGEWRYCISCGSEVAAG